MSDGRCEPDTVPFVKECDGVRVDVRASRAHCGGCEPTSCLTCDQGSCTAALGLLATNETVLVLPWTLQGVVQQWRAWGRGAFSGDGSTIPFAGSSVANTPVAAARDFDAHVMSEAVLCTSTPSVARGTLCVVRDGALRCAGRPLALETVSVAAVDSRWRRVTALDGVRVLGCERSVGDLAVPTNACAWTVATGEATAHLRCWTNWPGATPGAEVLFDGAVPETVGAIEMGDRFACALGRASGRGGVFCWGAPENVVSLGFRDAPEHPFAARRVALADDPVQLTVGRKHACVVLRAGQVWCWGEDFAGQLGVGERDLVWRMPGAVLVAPGEPLQGAREAHTYNGTTCARVAQGAAAYVHCWGANLFNGTPGAALGVSVVATRVRYAGGEALTVFNDPNGEHVVAVGYGSACAITADARNVACWGRGALGIGRPLEEGGRVGPSFVRF